MYFLPSIPENSYFLPSIPENSYFLDYVMYHTTLICVCPYVSSRITHTHLVSNNALSSASLCPHVLMHTSIRLIGSPSPNILYHMLMAMYGTIYASHSPPRLLSQLTLRRLDAPRASGRGTSHLMQVRVRACTCTSCVSRLSRR